eukprot:TRINITY_DN31902_c0_g1_i5.p1 TRINITY_DN31902_c0_g1~~TRINITY_DN31902_c0_g1_i5.p1  ORF type:complete len:415 (+),score=22.51 TRINITY_DN31902_c0_g1_i5:167-1411(+)
MPPAIEPSKDLRKAALWSLAALLPLLLRCLLKVLTSTVTRPCKRLFLRCFGGQHGELFGLAKLDEPGRQLLLDRSQHSTVLEDVLLPAQFAGFTLPCRALTGTLLPRGAFFAPVGGVGIENAEKVLWHYKPPGQVDCFNCDDLTWSEACSRYGLPSWAVALVAASRLLFWHLLQVVLFVLLFLAYYSELPSAEQAVCCLLGVRELLYALYCIGALIFNPVIFLLDPFATPGPLNKPVLTESERIWYETGWECLVVRNYKVLMFLFAPEKILGIYFANVFEERGYQRTHDCLNYVVWASVSLDICATISLVAGLASQTLPIPVAVAYCFPFLSATTTIYVCLRSIQVYNRKQALSRPQENRSGVAAAQRFDVTSHDSGDALPGTSSSMVVAPLTGTDTLSATGAPRAATFSIGCC